MAVECATLSLRLTGVSEIMIEEEKTEDSGSRKGVTFVDKNSSPGT